MRNVRDVETRLEAAENLLLRRADWRFLLPDPRPARSVCFAGGALRRAVAAISLAAIDALAAPPAGCDLAVVANPSDATLRRAWAALRPGGSLYAEQHLPLPGGAGALRRRLERRGFRDVACYWPWPSPAAGSAQLWFPLGAPGALRFFLGQRPAARGLLGRAGRTLRRTLWLLGLGLGVTPPICAVARKPADDTESGCPTEDEGQPASPLRLRSSVVRPAQEMDIGRIQRAADPLRDAIRAEWAGWGVGAPPERLSWLVMTGGYRSTNKIVALAFAEPDPRPRLAVKMARVPESVAALAHEAAMLRAVQARRPGLAGVPRVLLERAHGDGVALVESAVVGLPLFTYLRRENYADLAAQATDWLIALAGRPAPIPRARWWHRLVAPVLDEFAGTFGAVADPALLGRARELLETLGDLPLACEQRDFGPWNVLIAYGGGLGVLDWESAELDGLPALDLIYFLAYLAFFFDGAIASGRYRESYRVALRVDSLTGRVQRECLARYARAVGLKPDALRPLRVLAWMLHARSEYRRMVADAGERPSDATLRAGLFLGLWEEELRLCDTAGEGSEGRSALPEIPRGVAQRL